jgi:hypothetical protein
VELFENAKIAAFPGCRPDAQLVHAGAWLPLLSLPNDDSFGLGRAKRAALDVVESRL